MDLPRRDLDDRESLKSRRSGRKSLNKSYSESPSKPTTPKIKREKALAKKKKKEEKFYATKHQAILAEKLVEGKVYLLVNWADDPITGEPYAPGWEPEENVDNAGKEQWTEQKQEGLVVGGVLRILEDHASEQSTKRRQSSAHLSQEQGPSKKPRRAGTSETARFQSAPKQEVLEVKDTYEEDTLLPSTQSIQVRVGVSAGFDRGQYQPILVSSQVSQESSQEVSLPRDSKEDHSLQDSLAQESTQYSSQIEDRRSPAPQHSQFVIPDSQDQGDSASYEPSTNPARTQEATQQDSEPDTQPVELVEDSQLELSNPDSIDTDAVEEPLDEVDIAYQTTSSLNEGVLATASSSSHQSRVSPFHTIPESTQPVHESRLISQNLTINSSQHLSPNHEPQYSQDGHAISTQSQPFQSTGQSLRASYQEPTVDSPSQHQNLSQNREPQSTLSDQQVVANSLLSPVNTRLHNSLPVSQDSKVRQRHRSQNKNPPNQRSWSENIWNAPEVVSSLPRSHSASVTSASRRTQRETFVQFSAPSQLPTRIHHRLASATRHDTFPYPEPIPSTPNSGRVLQSIEGFDEDETPSPDRKYDSPSSSDNMDEDAAARKAAFRAARRSGLTQKLSTAMANSTASPVASQPISSLPVLTHLLTVNDEAQGQIAASIIASSLPPPPLPVPNHQLPVTDEARDQMTILKEDLIEDIQTDHAAITPKEDVGEDFEEKEFAFETGAAEEFQQYPLDGPFEENIYDEYTDVSPENTKDVSLRVQPSSENEFFLPLPFIALTRDVYHKQQGRTRELRKIFTESETLTLDIVRQIDKALLEFDLICSHSDLLEEDSSTQGMDTLGARAKFAENVSTKCVFVAELLNSMRQLDKRVAILVRPGRMLEILQAVLEYHRFELQPQSRTEYRYSGTISGSLRVSLVSSDSADHSYPSPDLMIAFDSTFNEELNLTKLRLHREGQISCPLVHPLVVFSIEHISKAVSIDIEDVERKIKICNILSEYVHRVGILEPGYPDPERAAELISEFVAAGSRANEWPCPSMPLIEDIDATTQVNTESLRHSLSYTTPIPSMAPPPVQQGAKRLLEHEDDIMDVGTPKRQRLTPLPDDELGPSSFPPFSKNQNGHLEMLSTREKSFLAQEHELYREIADLKETLRETEESEVQARQFNRSLQAQVDDLRSSITDIVPKYRAALNERGEFEHQANEAITRAGKLKHNLDSKNDEISKLKERNQNLEADLATARSALTNSSIPEVAELGKLNAKILVLTEEKEKLEKNKLSTSKEVDFMRSQYQNASTLASESSKALVALQTDLEIARAKADETRIEIHRIQRTSDVQNLSRMNKQLRLEKTEMARELEKRTNELAAATSGRRSARGVSAPMLSPRLAGSLANGMSRAAANRVRDSSGAASRGGSRGTSPVGGEYQRGFTPVGSSSSRFTPTGPFGDVLPSHAGGSGNRVEGGSRRRDMYRPT